MHNPNGTSSSDRKRWVEALHRQGKSLGYRVEESDGETAWHHPDWRTLRFRHARSSPSRPESLSPDDSLRGAGCRIWVGNSDNAILPSPEPADWFIDEAALLTNDESVTCQSPLGRDEELRVTEAERFPSSAGNQSILSFEAPRLARALRPGQFLNVAPSSAPYHPRYRVVNGPEDGSIAALDPVAHHLARVPLSMLRVFRTGSSVPAGIGPVPADMAFHLQPTGADRVSVAIREVGLATRALCETRAGDLLRVLGPLGQPERVPDGARRVILLAGGIGFAPLYGIALQCHWRRIPVLFLAGARVREHLFPNSDRPDRFVAPEFHDIGLEMRTTTEAEDGRFATDLLSEALSGPEWRSADLIYACGPSPMMARAASLCDSAGIPCRVFLEKRMECGVGVCMSCVCGIRRDDGEWTNARVCREGTVFDASRIRWR